jgi:hypothetical protein
MTREDGIVMEAETLDAVRVGISDLVRGNER